MPTPDKTPCSAEALAVLKDSAKGTLSDQVTAALKAYIANGEVLPGARLPTEPVLSERFGVSRTVIREAISRLKSAGLVEVRGASAIVPGHTNSLHANSTGFSSIQRFEGWRRLRLPPHEGELVRLVGYYLGGA